MSVRPCTRGSTLQNDFPLENDPTRPFNFSRVHHRGRTDENSLEPGRGRAGRARVHGRANRRRGRARRVGRRVSDDQRRRRGRPVGGAGRGRRPAVRAGRRGQRAVFERHRFGPRLRVSPLRGSYRIPPTGRGGPNEIRSVGSPTT